MGHFQKAERLLSAMMDSVDLSSRAPTATSARARRFSDTDRTVSKLHRLFVKSRNQPSEVSQSGPEVPSDTEPANSASSMPSTLEQHHCLSAECAVTTMFETTELLEIVLDFLDTETIMQLRRTSRRWNETIRASPTLRLHYFVHPQWAQPASEFRLLDFKLPGLSIEPGDDIDLGKWISVSMTKAAARRICAIDGYGHRVRSRSIFEGMRGGLGRRAQREGDDLWPALAPTPTREKGALQHEDLHVVQPPILGMQAYIIDPEPFAGPSQPNGQPSSSGPVAKLHCDRGITLGFLAETAQSLLRDPKRPSETDVRTVLFRAIVSFTASNGAPRRRGAPRTVTRLG